MTTRELPAAYPHGPGIAAYWMYGGEAQLLANGLDETDAQGGGDGD